MNPVFWLIPPVVLVIFLRIYANFFRVYSMQHYIGPTPFVSSSVRSVVDVVGVLTDQTTQRTAAAAYLIYKSLFNEYPKLRLDCIKKFVYYFVIFQGGEHHAHHQIQCRSPQRL